MIITERFKSRPYIISSELVTQDILGIARDISMLEKASIPSEWPHYTQDQFSDMLANGAMVVVTRDNRTVTGATISFPLNSSMVNVLESCGDIQATPNNQTLYTVFMAIHPQARGLETFLILGRKLRETAKEKGYTTLATHARTSNGLSLVLQRRWNASKIRSFDNWSQTGERFDYLEIPIKHSSHDST